MISVLIGGFLQGVLYGLLGLGLVLVYRQSRILNFSHGAVATLAAYVAYGLLGLGLPYVVAILGAILVGAVASALTELLVVRPLASTSHVTVSIGTLGVALAVVGTVSAIWGTSQRPLRGPVALGATVQLGGVSIGAGALVAIGAVLVIGSAIYLVTDRTNIGLAVRASSEGPLTAGMLGVNVHAVGSWIWALSGALAAVAGVLVTAQNYLAPSFMTDFMVVSFVAVVLGGFESILGVLLGGVLFGLFSAVFVYEFTDKYVQLLSFGTILCMLVMRPNGLLGRRLQRVNEPQLKIRARPKLRGRGTSLGRRWRMAFSSTVNLLIRRRPTVSIGVCLIALFIAPFTASDSELFLLASVAVMVIAVLSQNLISGWGGLMSLGQTGFMAVGAYVAVIMQIQMHWSFLLAVFAGGLVAMAAGVVFGLPALRLEGVYIALLTTSFALAIPSVVAIPVSLTGGWVGLPVPVPSIGLPIGGSIAIYVTMWSFAGASVFVCWWMVRGYWGRLWIAVRESEPGAASIGINVATKKLQVFAVSAGLAGVSGALFAVLIGYLVPDSYSLWQGIFLLVAVVVGGSGSIAGSVIGAAFIVIVPYYSSGAPQVAEAILGVVLVAALLIFPRGLVQLGRTGYRGPLSREVDVPPRASGALARQLSETVVEAASSRQG